MHCAIFESELHANYTLIEHPDCKYRNPSSSSVYYYCYYRAIRSIGRDNKFTVYFLCVCTFTDFSAGALPVGVKFCTAVRPHLRQVFSYFGVDSPRDGRVMGVNRGHMAGYASYWSSYWLIDWWDVMRCVCRCSRHAWNPHDTTLPHQLPRSYQLSVN